MIECDYFLDPGAGEKGQDCHNARVQEDHSVNATFYTEEEVRDALASVWNAKYPDNQVAPEDFHFNESAPYTRAGQ